MTDLVDRLRAAGCVFAEDEARLLAAAATTPAELAALTQRRISGEPLEHVLGWADFCGYRIAVRPGVFVPRRRTELLARRAMSVLRAGHVLVDLCTGSGAVAVAVARSGSPGEVHATDVDPVAVGCARRNLAGLGEVHRGDLFDPLPARLRDSIDVLTVNAPYVPTGELDLLPRDAREHEPHTALDGGADGLDIHRRVVAEAGQWLSDTGCLLFEVSLSQAGEARRIASRAGLAVTAHRDGTTRTAVLVARRRPAAQGTSAASVR